MNAMAAVGRGGGDWGVQSPSGDEDIAAWQAGWHLPSRVLDDVVRRASGAGVAVDRRVLEGHENEVHDVTNLDGRQVIVRVAWRPGPVFEREVWPMEMARRLGLPVADMVLIEHARVDDAEVSINVQQRLPGVPLHRLGSGVSDDVRRSITEQAGGLLAALHSIERDRPGSIGADGTTWPEATPAASVDRIDELLELLARRGVDAELLRRSAVVLADATELVAGAPVRLIHGDWTVANLLSDGHTITGVVDWSGARGGDPAGELSGWEFWSDHGPTAIAHLLCGYTGAGGVVDDAFHRRRRIYRVANRLDAMSHFLATSRGDLFDRAHRDLVAAVA